MTAPVSRDPSSEIRDVIYRLSSHLGISVQITSIEVEEAEESSYLVRLESPDSQRLIGERGETLRAYQYLISTLLRRRLPATRLTVDVAGYLDRQRERLTREAEIAAQRVLQTDQEVELRPMNPAERRLIHIALAEHPEVETSSRGEGPSRRVVIHKRSA